MATRTPVVVMLAQLGTTATTYTVPSNSVLTIASVMFNNSTAAARTVSGTITPSGGSALAAVSAMPVPAAGAAPTTAAGLVGQSLTAGSALALTADANSAVVAWISGYLQQ